MEILYVLALYSTIFKLILVLTIMTAVTTFTLYSTIFKLIPGFDTIKNLASVVLYILLYLN